MRYWINMNSLFRKPNYRLLFFAGLLVTGSTLSQAQTPKPAEAPKKLLMWKAQSGSNTVYLVGSIHIGSKEMYPLPKVMDDAFKNSKVMVVEVNVNKVDQTAALQYMSTGMYQDDDNLWKHLSKPTAAKVKKFFSQHGMDETAAGKFKPWLAGIMASVLPMMSAGMQADLGIDKHFLDLAEGKKEIVEAETADFQFKLLASVPDNLADTYLSWSVGEATKSREDDMKLERLWRQGDASAIDEVTSQYPKELEHLMRSLLQDRNPHMADIAEKYLKVGGGPCFFVVGAAHLVGKDGVVAILQKRGYHIEQLSAK